MRELGVVTGFPVGQVGAWSSAHWTRQFSFGLRFELALMLADEPPRARYAEDGNEGQPDCRRPPKAFEFLAK